MKKTHTLPWLDRLLTLWIFLSMGIGLLISEYVPSFTTAIHHISIGHTSLPIAIGLLIMMYPPLAKVDLRQFIGCFSKIKLVGLSLVFNWIVGPLLMFFLSLIFLHGKPLYMMGLIIVGLARCIAMVIVWNDLAEGNRAYCAMLVAINAIFQMVAFSFYAYLFLHILLPFFGIHGVEINFSAVSIAKSVLIYLGIPFVLGLGGRLVLVNLKGVEWYINTYLPLISPLTLIALLYTIVLLFSVQGADLLKLPLDVLQISIPLIIYFLIMFLTTYISSKKFGVGRESAITLAFTSASNNFELAIAISIATFGVHSPVALAAVVGPLVEVPVMLLLVRLSKLFR